MIDLNTIAHEPESVTLASNTGLNSQPAFTVAIDWLDFTYRDIAGADEAYSIVSDLEALVSDQIDFCVTRPSFNGRHWDGTGHGAKGSLIWYSAASEDENGNPIPASLKVALSGSVLGNCDSSAIATYLNATACNRNIDCTRIDVALDDHRKFIQMWKITEAGSGGHFFNCSYYSHIISGNRGEDKGVTNYFGSTASDKRLRVYDKTVESKGKIDSNRWEAQFRRKPATQVFQSWLSASREGEYATARYLQNIVVGLIDFRERNDDDPNRDRCKPLNWYEDLCRTLRATPARITVAAVVKTAQKSINWIKKSVAPSLATLKNVLKEDFQQFIEGTISSGEERLSIIRRKIIATENKEQLLY